MLETKWMRPVLDVHKAAFQGWYQSVSSLQDQAEQMMHSVWDQVPVLPESSKQMLNLWTDLYKKEQENIKSTVDLGFEAFEQILGEPEKKQETKPEKSKSASSKTASSEQTQGEPEKKQGEEREGGQKSKASSSKTASSS